MGGSYLFKMAAAVLVVMGMLLPSIRALTTGELSQITARNHTEQNTGYQGTVSVTTTGSYYQIVSNGIPDHNTGTFPASSNPHTITTQTFSYRFAQSPAIASTANCLPGGTIAFSKNGIPLFSPFTFNGNNAVEGEYAEVFDSCDGHPDQQGTYHYHQTPDCLYAGGNDEFVGVAMDGFPIYGIKDSNGTELTSADLDMCHGREENGEYRYRLTRDYPYIMGCFKGTPSPDYNQMMLMGRSCLFASAGVKAVSVLMMITALLTPVLL